MKAFAQFTPSLLHSPPPRRLRNVTARRRPDAAQSATTTPGACFRARDAQHRPPGSTTKMTPTQQYHRGERQRSYAVAAAIRQPRPRRSLPLPAAVSPGQPQPARTGCYQPEQAAPRTVRRCCRLLSQPQSRPPPSVPTAAADAASTLHRLPPPPHTL